jgi:hypothetical protein
MYLPKNMVRINETEAAVDLFDVLFSWWWYGQDGRTKTADAADKWLMPVLLVACAAVAVVALVMLAKR